MASKARKITKEFWSLGINLGQPSVEKNIPKAQKLLHYFRKRAKRRNLAFAMEKVRADKYNATIKGIRKKLVNINNALSKAGASSQQLHIAPEGIVGQKEAEALSKFLSKYPRSKVKGKKLKKLKTETGKILEKIYPELTERQLAAKERYLEKKHEEFQKRQEALIRFMPEAEARLKEWNKGRDNIFMGDRADAKDIAEEKRREEEEKNFPKKPKKGVSISRATRNATDAQLVGRGLLSSKDMQYWQNFLLAALRVGNKELYDKAFEGGFSFVKRLLMQGFEIADIYWGFYEGVENPDESPELTPNRWFSKKEALANARLAEWQLGRVKGKAWIKPDAMGGANAKINARVNKEFGI